MGLTVVIIVGTVLYLHLKASMPPLVQAEGASATPGSIGALLLQEKVADIGQFVSGLAGAIAFIWLVAAYVQQSFQLSMQREELGLQRHELALQRAEFERLADEAKAQVDVLKQSSAFL